MQNENAGKTVEQTNEEPHTIYTHPEENEGRLNNIIQLLDKLNNILEQKTIEQCKQTN